MAKLSTHIITDSPVGESVGRQKVYGGNNTLSESGPAARGNRPVTRRQRSPFTVLFVVALVSSLIVFYIWNKISVNKLTEEVNNSQVQYQKVIGANEILRAEINQKSRLERIGAIATEQLLLSFPKEQPIWFQVDQHYFQDQ